MTAFFRRKRWFAAATNVALPALGARPPFLLAQLPARTNNSSGHPKVACSRTLLVRSQCVSLTIRKRKTPTTSGGRSKQILVKNLAVNGFFPEVLCQHIINHSAILATLGPAVCFDYGVDGFLQCRAIGQAQLLN